jgi:hypothetical protein
LTYEPETLVLSCPLYRSSANQSVSDIHRQCSRYPPSQFKTTKAEIFAVDFDSFSSTPTFGPTYGRQISLISCLGPSIQLQGSVMITSSLGQALSVLRRTYTGRHRHLSTNMSASTSPYSPCPYLDPHQHGYHPPLSRTHTRSLSRRCLLDIISKSANGLAGLGVSAPDQRRPAQTRADPKTPKTSMLDSFFVRPPPDHLQTSATWSRPHPDHFR